MTVRSVTVAALMALGLASDAQAASPFLQGPKDQGLMVVRTGTVSAWQERGTHGGCVRLILDPAGGGGHLWACSRSLSADQATAWILRQQEVQVQGAITGMQRTRVGANWRTVSVVEPAMVREVAVRP